MVIDRLNQRLASPFCFVSQALALLVVNNFRDEAVLIAACAVVGFSAGNLITLPLRRAAMGGCYHHHDPPKTMLFSERQ